jgi:hypothetical protein
MGLPHRKHVALALLGKGASNHLHRSEVISALQRRGFSVKVLVRDDYSRLIEKYPGCEYIETEISTSKGGLRSLLRGILQYARSLYPTNDPAKKYVFDAEQSYRNISSRMFHSFLRILATSRGLLICALAIERHLYTDVQVVGPNPETIDVLCLVGFGGNELLDCYLQYWASRHNLPTLNLVGNYDNLSTKGFRGHGIDRLLVWGDNMQQDAVTLQALLPNRITKLGPLKYDRLASLDFVSRADFFTKRGLNERKTTILFAGGRDEFHYFEILDALSSFDGIGDVQIIIRIMPNKSLLASPEMKFFIAHATALENVFLSFGDTNYRQGRFDLEPIIIEEDELWHALRYCDLVINLFSTLALEACIFDKPIVNMWYFRPASRMVLNSATYVPYNQEAHIRRLRSYNCSVDAHSRTELHNAIVTELRYPSARHVGRKNLVMDECGTLDGKAADRFAVECENIITNNGVP